MTWQDIFSAHSTADKQILIETLRERNSKISPGFDMEATVHAWEVQSTERGTAPRVDVEKWKDSTCPRLHADF